MPGLPLPRRGVPAKGMSDKLMHLQGTCTALGIHLDDSCKMNRQMEAGTLRDLAIVHGGAGGVNECAT